MALSVDAHRGLLLLAATPYDDAIVDWIRTLPERHYRPRAQAWCVPARREQLRHVSALIGELEERGIAGDISDSAGARLARADVGRVISHDNAIEITGPTARADSGPARTARAPLRHHAPNLDHPP